jgi:hypothetical protein
MTSPRTKALRIRRADRGKSTEVIKSIRRGLAQAVEIAGENPAERCAQRRPNLAAATETPINSR